MRAWIDGGRRLTYDPLPTSSSVLRDEPAVVVAARVAVVVAVAVVREWHGVERLRPPKVLLLPACVVPESQQNGHDFMHNSGFSFTLSPIHCSYICVSPHRWHC